MAKGIALRTRNGLHRPPLWLVFLAFPSIALSAPAEIYVGLDSRYSDNITKASGAETEDIEHRVSLRGNVQTDPGTCVARADGEVAYSIYDEETYDPQTEVNAGFTGSCELARGLTWVVDNQLRDLVRSSRFNDTPDNRTRKNIFSTGPTYIWRPSRRNSIQLSTRYENTEYSEPEDPDSERAIGSVAWEHRFAPDLSAGLSSSISMVEVDTGAEVETRTVSTTFNKRWATTSVSGSVGVSEIETEFGSTQQKSDGFVGDLNLTRALDSRASIYLRASRELTDQTSSFDVRFDEFTFELTDSLTVEATTLEAGLNKPFSNGDVFSLAAYGNRSDYLDTGEREDRVGVRTGYTRRITPLLAAVANASYEYLVFESDQSDDQIAAVDIGLTYSLTPRTELAATVGRNQRTSDVRSQEFEENWALLSIDYKLR